MATNSETNKQVLVEITEDEELIKQLATDGLLNKNPIANEIVYLNSKYESKYLLKASKQKFNEGKGLYFYINKNTKLKGKITNLVEEHKKKIPLLKVCLVKVDSGGFEKKLYLFNERLDKRYTGNIIDSLEGEFYIYQMISKNKSYLILSKKQLELQEYEIEGSLIELPDYSDIGKYCKLGLKLPMIFVHTAKKRVVEYKSHEELFNSIKELNLTEDKLLSYILSLSEGGKRKYYRHPKVFERLIASFLFGAKYDSYPLHLLIIARTGSGKSKIEECLHEKMKEVNNITEGACSTMKSLIPSFKGNYAKTGDFLSANRIVFVDEFLRILQRVEKEDRANHLAMLNPLLEHKKRRFGSGNNSFEGCSTAKFMSVSNPIYKTKNMYSLVNRIDKSFLARLLPVYQSEKHIKEIEDQKLKPLEDVELNIDSNLWLSIYDYLNSFKVGFGNDKVVAIFNEGLKCLDGIDLEDVRHIYTSRYNHHLSCLIDGLVKLRCLCSGDSSFTAKAIDYKNAREIWLEIIKNWNVAHR